MVSLGVNSPYVPMTKEKALEWLKALDDSLVETIDVEYAAYGEYPCLPEHDSTVPYEELFFLSADGS